MVSRRASVFVVVGVAGALAVVVWLAVVAWLRAPLRAHIAGEVKAYGSFEAEFGEGFVLELTPVRFGWFVVIKAAEDPTRDLAWITRPAHFVPNPRSIEGWHFRNRDNTGPNAPGPGNVNAPGRERHFEFRMPGQSIPYPLPDAYEMPSHGAGKLVVRELELSPVKRGERAWIQKMTFDVWLTWPRQEL